MLLEGGVTQNNYLDKDGNAKVLDDVYAAKIRENVIPYIDDYIKEKKDFSDWKKKAYTGEALQLLSGLVPMGTVGNLSVRGLVSGLAGGAIEGFGRGLVEDKNPLQTAIYDAAIGGLTGGSLGALGKYASQLEGKKLPASMNIGGSGDDVLDLTGIFSEKASSQDVKNYIAELVKEGAMPTKTPDYLIDVPDKSINKRHIQYKNNWNKMPREAQDRHNSLALKLKEMIKNSEHTGKSKINTKKDTKKNIQKYHYFTVNVKDGENVFPVVLDAEQLIGESEVKPQTVHLYNFSEK